MTMNLKRKSQRKRRQFDSGNVSNWTGRSKLGSTISFSRIIVELLNLNFGFEISAQTYPCRVFVRKCLPNLELL